MYGLGFFLGGIEVLVGGIASGFLRILGVAAPGSDAFDDGE